MYPQINLDDCFYTSWRSLKINCHYYGYGYDYDYDYDNDIDNDNKK